FQMVSNLRLRICRSMAGRDEAGPRPQRKDSGNSRNGRDWKSKTHWDRDEGRATLTDTGNGSSGQSVRHEDPVPQPLPSSTRAGRRRDVCVL
ncbi:hypothetical protein T310_8637, partial [Rasamsonia emersonii CBS 393.64]